MYRMSCRLTDHSPVLQKQFARLSLYYSINKLCARRHNIPAPLLPRGRPSASRAAEQTQVAVLSHAEYVPTLTAEAALRVKAALSKAVW